MKTFLKIFAGVLLVLAVVLFFVAQRGQSAMFEQYTASSTLSSVPTDSASLAYGAHLANIFGCRDCHGDNLAGKVFLDIPPFRAVPSNLTSGKGGVADQYKTVQDWDVAIRHGVTKSGRGMIIMPSPAFHKMNDEDAAALIAWIQSVPPVDNVLPPTELKFLGKVLAGFGAIDFGKSVNPEPTNTIKPDTSDAVAYGGYFVNSVCSYCHGEDLRGGPAEGQPIDPPDLRPVKNWSFEQFKKTLREGITPSGKKLDTFAMPIAATKHYTDFELRAIYAYLQTLK